MEHNPGGEGVERANTAIFGLGKHQALEIPGCRDSRPLDPHVVTTGPIRQWTFHEPPLVADAPAPCPRDRCV